MTLYEIDSRIQELLNDVDPETGELLADDAAFDALAMEREAKIENVACCIKNLTADVAALKAEEDVLAKRRKAAENTADRLRGYLLRTLQGNKFHTAKCAISFYRSQALEVADGFVEWAMQNNDNLLRYKAPEINKVQVRKLLLEGAEIPGASLVENTSVIIK